MQTSPATDEAPPVLPVGASASASEFFEGLDDLDEVACSDALVASVTSARRAEVTRLVLVGRWAVLRSPDRAVPVEASVVRKRAQGQRLDLGGDGTPAVSAFAHDELGCYLGVSTYVASNSLRDVLNLQHRHPILWQAVLDLAIEPWLARRVTAMAHAAGLTREQCLALDEQTTPAILDLPTGRALAVVEAAIIRADPQAHQAKLEADRTRQGVWLGRRNSVGDPAGDGTGLRSLVARGTTLDLARVMAMVNHLAQLLAAAGDEDTLDVRRAKALALLANPAQACVLLAKFHPSDDDTDPADTPTAPDQSGPAGTAEATEATLPFPDGDIEEAGDAEDTDEPAEPAEPSAVDLAVGLGRSILALGPKALNKLRPRSVFYFHHAPGSPVVRPGDPDQGPLSVSEVTEHLLKSGAEITVKPVINLADIPAADAYETPPPIAEAIHLAHPFDVFPYGTTRAASCDLDHTVPYRQPDKGGPPGQTRVENLGPLNRHHHLAKTHGGFTLHQPLPGVFYWRTPAGHWLEVTPHGTRHRGRDTPELIALTQAKRQQSERDSPLERQLRVHLVELPDHIRLADHLIDPDPPA